MAEERYAFLVGGFRHAGLSESYAYEQRWEAEKSVFENTRLAVL